MISVLKKIKNWYDDVTWRKTTEKYCEKLKNAKMGLGDR
tara:strand:- start:46 stop:162 length:117 start_codon:yes stop_codon:yes gene_type:complete